MSSLVEIAKGLPSALRATARSNDRYLFDSPHGHHARNLIYANRYGREVSRIKATKAPMQARVKELKRSGDPNGELRGLQNNIKTMTTAQRRAMMSGRWNKEDLLRRQGRVPKPPEVPRATLKARAERTYGT